MPVWALGFLLNDVDPGPKEPLAPVEISPASPLTILAVHLTGLVLTQIIRVLVHAPLDGKRDEGAYAKNHEN